MTKAFLEPMIIKTESEELIINAFSKKSLKKIQIHNSAKKKLNLKYGSNDLNLDLEQGRL